MTTECVLQMAQAPSYLRPPTTNEWKVSIANRGFAYLASNMFKAAFLGDDVTKTPAAIPNIFVVKQSPDGADAAGSGAHGYHCFNDVQLFDNEGKGLMLVGRFRLGSLSRVDHVCAAHGARAATVRPKPAVEACDVKAWECDGAWG